MYAPVTVRTVNWCSDTQWEHQEHLREMQNRTSDWEASVKEKAAAGLAALSDQFEREFASSAAARRADPEHRTVRLGYDVWLENEIRLKAGQVVRLPRLLAVELICSDKAELVELVFDA